MPWPEDENIPDYLDSSSLTTLAHCPRAYYYSQVRRIILAGENIDLAAGGAYASALETFRKIYYTKIALDPGMGAPVRWELFLHAAAEGLLSLMQRYGADPRESEQKSLFRVAAAYESYLNFYHPEKDYLTPVLINNEPAVEVSFAIPVPDSEKYSVFGTPIIFCGKFDLLAEYVPDTPQARSGGIYVVDDKTTKGIGKTFPQSFEHRSQFTGYVWAGLQYGFNVKGAIVRGTAILATETKHLQVPTERPLYMIANWEERVRHHIASIRRYVSASYWPQTGMECDACMPFHKECQYKLLCSSRDPERWIPVNYVENKWHPVDKPKEDQE